MGITRRTRSVGLILNQFDHDETAISVVDLVERLGHKINKTTVYRVLDKLEDDGILHSFLGNNGIKWYAKCQGCSDSGHQDTHPHFQCLDCGKVECLSVALTLPEIPKRQVIHSQLLIQGKCESCLT